jgi:hypothetical protein
MHDLVDALQQNLVLRFAHHYPVVDPLELHVGILQIVDKVFGPCQLNEFKRGHGAVFNVDVDSPRDVEGAVPPQVGLVRPRDQLVVGLHYLGGEILLDKLEALFREQAFKEYLE